MEGELRGLDFSSIHSLVATLLGLALVTLIGMGVRLLMMVTIQQRRERANRQINERLRTLIAAYKTRGGSFTGDLSVDPTHLRDLRNPDRDDATPPIDLSAEAVSRSDRKRRTRDAVESVLSDIILLGTDEQVRLASRAAEELVAGRPVHTHELVVSLRTFIRDALDLAPIPDGVAIPMQGPARPSAGGTRGKGEGGQSGGRSGGGAGGGGGGGMGMGMGMGGGMAMGGLAGDAHNHPDEHG